MKRPTIHISTTESDLALDAASRISEIVHETVSAKDRCAIALAGGETPRSIYRALSTGRFADTIAWEKVHIFTGDERMVSPDDPQSNFNMIRNELLLHVPIPDKNIHRMKGERESVEAARMYAEDLTVFFGDAGPRFDCILLGIGEDGHTASLFPGTPAIDETTAPVTAVYVPRLRAWRMTLTLPVINAAARVLFLASGKRKAEIVHRILTIAAPSHGLPASLVVPHNGTTEWMLDGDAASLLH